MPLVVMLCATVAACREKQQVEGLPDEFSGVGIEITEEAHGKFRVVAVIPNSPAAEAGLVAGDTIVTVDGRPTAEMSFGEVVVRVRGATQSQVILTIERQSEIQTVVVSRRRIRKTGGTYAPTP